MPARVHNLVIDQGADYTLTIPVFDGANQPIVVDGWIAEGQIRSRIDAAELLHEFDLTPTGATVVLHVPAAVSRDWRFQLARYDVELTTPDELVHVRLIEGAVIVRGETTR